MLTKQAMDEAKHFRMVKEVIEHITGEEVDVKAAIEKETGLRPAWAPEAFADEFEDVRQSLRRVKASPFIPVKDSVRGFVFDVATGELIEVADA
jgi:carbonic anhydrase